MQQKAEQVSGRINISHTGELGAECYKRDVEFGLKKIYDSPLRFNR